MNTLTKTRKGASSPLLVIAGGKDAKNILLTARHHACEAIASYALEGFLEEALSDTPMGRAFREKYALHVVPFVDLDGVEAGDQGKGRKPHDHNRDYGIPEPSIRKSGRLTTWNGKNVFSSVSTCTPPLFAMTFTRLSILTVSVLRKTMPTRWNLQSGLRRNLRA